MTLPDSLSRLPTKASREEMPLDVQVNLVQFSQPRLAELRQETARDPVLNQLATYVAAGFPSSANQMTSDTKHYWSFRDELSLEDGILLKGQRTIIPAVLRQHYLSCVHKGHQGITRCQLRARESLYWPGMATDIGTMIPSCIPCQMHQSSQPQLPNMPIASELPSIPWYTLSSDLFTLDGADYLLIADYHSRYPLVERLTDSTSRAVAAITSKAISMFGIPHSILSDNGPQFSGRPYQDMIAQYGICHITSSPHHAKSHGFIERMVRTVKGTLRKTRNESDAAMLCLRTTPLGSDLPSPAELLFQRKIAGNLPLHAQGNHDEKLRHLRSPATRRQPSDDHHDLTIGMPVYVQDVVKRTWSPATILGTGPEPRSYTLRCEPTGRLLRRNRVLLRPRPMTSTCSDTLDCSDIPMSEELIAPHHAGPPTASLSPPPRSGADNPSSAPHQAITPHQHVIPSDDNSLAHRNQSRFGRTYKPTRRLIEQK